MTRRILVVDDDRSMVRTLCDIFRLRGWEPEGVYSGEDAVAAETLSDYDAVVMDIKLPGITGLEAFQAMKEINPDVKVVLMTAHTAPETIYAAERAGALRVLAKPVDLNELIGLLGTNGR